MPKKDINIFYAVIEPHLACLDDILNSTKPDLIELALELIGSLQIAKYDDCIRSKAFLKDNFRACIDFLKLKPNQKYLRILINNLSDFGHQQQSQILEILPLFNENRALTDHLIKHFDQFDQIQHLYILKAIATMLQIDGLTFVLNQLEKLSSQDQILLLEHLIHLQVKLDADQSRILISHYNSESEVHLKAAYLRSLRLVQEEVSIPLLLDNISKQPEVVMLAAAQTLIAMKKHAQIPVSFLTQYSSSLHYDLTCCVAQIYALLHYAHEDKETFKEGMNILSYLMNQDSKEAKLAAIEAAHHFITDARTQEWIGAMLFSENDIEICSRVVQLLDDYRTDNVKNFLIKAVSRDQSEIKVLAINSLASFEDNSLLDLYQNELKKNISDANVVRALVHAISRTISADNVEIYKEFLNHQIPEIQSAAIEGLSNFFSETLIQSLERIYQNLSGTSKATAACILFRAGVPYILDDLLQMIESPRSSDNKVGLQTLIGVVTYFHDTPEERFCQSLISILELYYREAEARIAREDVLLDFHAEHVLKIRYHFMAGDYKQCIGYIASLDDSTRKSFYISIAELWIQQLGNKDIDTDQCLRLVNQSADCFLGYEMLDKQYKKMKRRTEYLINQLRFLESRQKYYQEILALLETFSQEEVESPIFSNLLKVIRNGSLPLDHGIHHLFVQIYVKLRAYHKIFKHLTFGFLTMKQPNYIVELATSCMKCGYLEKTESICHAGLELETNEAARLKLKTLLKNIESVQD